MRASPGSSPRNLLSAHVGAGDRCRRHDASGMRRHVVSALGTQAVAPTLTNNVPRCTRPRR
jgi:hypothetical protein